MPYSARTATRGADPASRGDAWVLRYLLAFVTVIGAIHIAGAGGAGGLELLLFICGFIPAALWSLGRLAYDLVTWRPRHAGSVVAGLLVGVSLLKHGPAVRAYIEDQRVRTRLPEFADV